MPSLDEIVSAHVEIVDMQSAKPSAPKTLDHGSLGFVLATDSSRERRLSTRHSGGRSVAAACSCLRLASAIRPFASCDSRDSSTRV